MKRKRIDFNSPVILSFSLLSFVVLLLSLVTQDRVGEFLALRFTSWLSPMMYIRLFTHCITHMTFSHFSGNIMLLLVIGPIVEEKYGSQNLLLMILITSAATGLFTIIFFKNVMLLGASGIVFMLILLASFANMREGAIPLTVILVAIFYIGNELMAGLTVSDNISHSSHIIGGVCGAVFGFQMNKRKRPRMR